MSKTAKVTAEFDVNTGKFETGVQRAANVVKKYKTEIDLAAHATQILGGVLSAASWGKEKFDLLSGSIIKINSDFETLKTSLTGLISASHSNVNSLGRLMGVQEKWALSTKKADDTLQSLNKIASKTSFNLDQTAQMFKSFYSTANSNMSLKQSIEAFEGLANMASVVGINVDQMIRTLDGVGSGKWTSSELTRFLEGSLGLTKEAAQEAIKAGKYYDLLMEKTAEFAKMADATGNTFEAVTEAFKSEIENLTRSLTGGMFNSFKDGIKEATTFLKENKDAIVGAANTAVELAKHLGALGAAYYGARIANNLYDKAVKAMTASAPLSNQALSAKTKALGLLSISIDKAKTATLALKAAFRTFIPVAVIFGAVEAFMALKGSMDDAKISGDELNKILSRTNEELKKLTRNEIEYEKIKLSKKFDEQQAQLREYEKELKEFADKREFYIGKFRNNPNSSSLAHFLGVTDDGVAKTKSDIDGLKREIEATQSGLNRYSQELQRRNESVSQTAELVRGKTDELNDALDKASEKAKNVTTLGRLKTELVEIDGLIKNLQKPLNDPEKEKQRLDTLEALAVMREKTAKQIAEFNKQDIKNLGDINSSYREIARVGMSEYEKKLDDINQKYKKWIEDGVNKDIAKKARASLISALDKEEADKAIKEHSKFLKEKEELEKKYFETIGEYEKAWAIESKKYKEEIKKLGLTEEDAKKYLEIQKKKYLEPYVKNTKAAFKDIKNSWADTVSSMSKTVDDGFFNFFIGKTKSLKTALKDIGTNLMRDLISPYARTLSQGISGGFGALLGGGSNLASVAAGLGLAKNDRGGWDGTIGGTTVELSSTGQILRGADALDKSTTNLLSSISNLKTAYDTFTGSMGSGFANFGNYLSGMGYTGSGQFMSGVGGGISNLFGGNAALAGATSRGAATSAMAFNSASPYYTAGAGLGGGLVGGAAGYGIGTGLDKAFGAQTYAPQTGMAAGAAVGAYAGIYGLAAIPVWGWIAAAVLVAIGGMIGKSKITDWGYQVGQDLSLGLDKGLDGGVNNWKEKTKKSWFSKSVSNQTSPIDEQTQKMLNQYVRTNSVLLRDFTGGDFNLPARTYNKRTLIDEGFGGALIAGVMGKNYDKALSFGGNEGELEKTYRYWMEQAKQDKKETYDLLAEYVGKINSNIKNLKLESLNNSLEKMKFAKDEAMDALKTLNAGLGAFSGEIEYIGKDMAGQIEKAYREALKNDFSKETVQRYEALTEAYKKAKQAQDEYLKAVLNFTQSVAGTQSGFYQALGFDTNFLTLQNLYTRLRNIAGALESDLDDKEKSDVAKIGSSNDPRVWAKYFHDMGSAKLQEFLSAGNVEMRAELVKLAAEYRTFTAANGGRDVWLKSFSDIEAISKQIAALKLAEAAQNTLNLQREQLNLLNKQKSILEKIAQTAQKLRDSVIDSSTSELNYRFALERARIAYAAKDYDSTAYENLNTAVAKQEQFLKQAAGSYAEYKLSILKMASEIEGITGSASLDDINRQIKRLEGLLNSNSNSQLSALEAQKEALIKGANDQINAMELLLGSDSPIVRYLKDALVALRDGKAVPNYNGAIANLNNGAVTANGAVLSSQLDRDINAIYKDVLGRSVEQSGLDAWKRKALMENLSLPQIREQIIKTATAITGSSNKNDWIEWSKRQGLKPYAEGGIVTRPTRALIGEAGAEAVIPLKNGAVRAQIIGGDNSELVSLMREGVYLMKEINKNTREGTMVLKDVTNGTEFLVKAV